ncbi:hypothetical protein AB0C98_41720 [Streptomyces sp. NPDC048558]|uniref:hypothetical protein n=1 Tax=Streptomyces sp. NPDC048558 TaxID=3155759 RepID=UPI003416C8A3
MHNTDEMSTSSTNTAVRFGMPQAFVIVAFLAAAVVLSLTARMPVRDVALLLGAAGGVGVGVLLVANMKGGGRSRGGGRLLRRLLHAALGNNAGAGS